MLFKCLTNKNILYIAIEYSHSTSLFVYLSLLKLAVGYILLQLISKTAELLLIAGPH